MGRQVFVLGGGAAGLTAAVTAARSGASVTVLEHSKKCGQKILATGNGRCNLGNEHMEISCYHSEDPSFVQEVLSSWSVEDTKHFFEQLGVSVKSREGYLYPRSEQASCIRDLLLLEATHQKVKFKNDCQVERLLYQEGKWQIITPGWTYQADALIVATGSAASNIPGADGSGYGLLDALGLDIRKPLPALVPLICSGVNTRAWAGVRTEGRLKLFIDGRESGTVTGELQLTDYGVSGIPVFQVSGQAVRALEEGRKVQVQIDFLPEYTREALTTEYQLRKERFPYRKESELLLGLLPDRLLSMIPGEHPEDWIKELTLNVTGDKTLKFAQVASGGVKTLQVNPHTMESKSYPDLYFAGEVLDVDGICGGYNLHWAWATGSIAGRNCVKSHKSGE